MSQTILNPPVHATLEKKKIAINTDYVRILFVENLNNIKIVKTKQRVKLTGFCARPSVLFWREPKFAALPTQAKHVARNLNCFICVF